MSMYFKKINKSRLFLLCIVKNIFHLNTSFTLAIELYLTNRDESQFFSIIHRHTIASSTICCF